MKKLLLSVASMALLVSTACDKVKNAYPQQAVSSTLDWSLYPDGDSTHYVTQGLWPSFPANTNTLRNVLIEDFTGHQCVNCPAATANMEQLIATDPARIYGVGIHAGPTGITSFQTTNSAYPTVFYNDISIAIGKYFGQDMPGSSFVGNPAFCVNRIKAGNQFVSNAGAAIANKTSACLASTLKVNIQAQANYFAATRGLFLHTEVEKLDASLTSDLAIVVYVIEDSLVARQLVQPNTTWDPDGSPGDPNTPDGINETYVHRDILRDCIDGRAFGRILNETYLNANGKYYVNYSYKLPAQYDPHNMKLYIYVYDKSTEEIYQVIEKHLL